MPAAKKTSRRPANTTARTKRSNSTPPQLTTTDKLKRPFIQMWKRRQDFLMRRPHRSFRRTRRRDYVRSLRLPGYWAFTNEVRRVLSKHKLLFILLALTYSLVTLAFVGLSSQEAYSQLAETLRTSSGDIFKGNWGQIGQASLLLTTTVSGSLSGQITDVQKIYATLAALMMWLTSVWLLRAIFAGRTPRLRDGLYTAGAPLLSTFLVAVVLVVQLLPLALAVIGITAAVPSGILDGGVIAMLFWIAAILLGVLSLYWISSTMIALVVITLPGMYPLKAIRTAGDLVVGRRLRVLLRFLWLAMTIIVSWALLLIPFIIFDAWIKGIFPGIQWVPLVPVAVLIVTSFTLLWVSAYVYMFYRKVVDDDAAPA